MWAIRSSGVAKRISLVFIQHSKDVKESWPFIEAGHVVRDQHCADSKIGKSEIGEAKICEVRVREGDHSR
jgi:hypothetical protein